MISPEDWDMIKWWWTDPAFQRNVPLALVVAICLGAMIGMMVADRGFAKWTEGLTRKMKGERLGKGRGEE